MNMQVNENWWKYIFDETYLLTDARSVCNDELTLQEVDFLEQTLLFDKSAPILDLCGGQGRHSLELSRRQFKNITVLDYSEYLLNLGKKIARQEQLNTVFIQCDARNIGFLEQIFRFIILMASSFGYFSKEKENQKILAEVFRILMPGGTVLLDLPNREYVLKNFKSSSSHKVNNDISAIRVRELGEDIIYSRETVISQSRGQIRENTYCTSLYSPEKISDLLYTAGFTSVTCNMDFMSRESEADYGCMTNRMIVIAKKSTS
jgi:D-alanine-D-alanine ligase